MNPSINCEELLFDPFELMYDKNNNPYEDFDPDANYYAKSHSLGESKYFETDEFNKIASRNKKLSLMHTNIRSATKNSNDLSNYLATLNHQFDIIALSETWLNKNNTDIIGFPNYSQVHIYRENKKGGGVSLLIKETIHYHELENLSIVSEILECIFIELEMERRNIIVGCLYRPPNSNMTIFNDEIYDLLKKLNNLNRDIYLLGDYNIDLLRSSTHQSTSDFVNIMFSSSFVPLINHPTRITDTSATLIDNIFTNRHNEHACLSGILPTDVSDHFPIFHIIHHDNDIVNVHRHTPHYKRIINNSTIETFKSNIQMCIWNNVIHCTDTDTAYKTFFNEFKHLYDKHIPLKKIEYNNKSPKKPWITNGLLNSIKMKNSIYKSMMITRDDSQTILYKKYRNKLTNLLKIAEKSYYKKQLENSKSNLSKMWKTLNNIINRRKNSIHSIVFKHNNCNVSNNVDIANHFNNYFLHAPNDLCKNLPPASKDPCSYLKKHFNESFFMTPTDENEILKILSHIKNSSAGHDGIDIKVIKDVATNILEPLTHICNLSLAMGKIPSELKIAKIVPIHKKGAKDKFSNYRPVSVLPAFSKLFEKLVYNRMISFVEKFNILNDNQFGFRKNRSTCLALDTLVDKFHNTIEKNEIMIGLFIDLSRAFDTMSHEILLKKLYIYGFRGIALNWIKDYLSNRKQFVVYNNEKSQMVDFNIGVPQGSILGPLLFLLYVNELPEISHKLSYVQFADDTNIFITGKSLSDISSIINEEMILISEWIKNNRLSLNVVKTNYMIMSSRAKQYDCNDCVISIDDVILERVYETKFLGVMLDDKLLWKSHIEYICNKISKCMGILIKARKILGICSLVTLYNALIKPYLIYCNIIWGNTYTKYLNKVNILQKKIIRIITFSGFNTHTGPLFRKLKIMSTSQLYDYFTSIFVFRSLNNLLPERFTRIFVHNVTSRKTCELRPHFCTKKASEFSIKFSGPNIWNKLPRKIQTSKSVSSFKSQMKKEILKAC